MAEAEEQPWKPKIEIEAYTYHCICTQLILATTTPLHEEPKRAYDLTTILNLPPEPTTWGFHAVVTGTVVDKEPTAVRGDGGFEKRYMHRCSRCDVVIGYTVDRCHLVPEMSGRMDELIMLLPGGLMTTAEMEKGKNMEREIGLVQTKR